MNTRENVIIIGAGNIGSRHAQAFARSEKDITLIIIDPSQQSLETCRNRINEVSPSSKINVVLKQDINDLPKKTLLAVIATNSAHRLGSLENLLSFTQCEYLILEKFLFSEVGEYKKAEQLILKNKVNRTYVNCVKRCFEAYNWLKKELRTNDEHLAMQVTGNDWGLACNSIHYIDLFQFFTGKKIKTCEFTADGLGLAESKRAGYMELTGQCSVEDADANQLKLESTPGIPGAMDILVQKGSLNFKVKEQGNTIVIEGKGINKQFDYPFQSSLSLLFLNKCFLGESLPLPEYEESAEQHITFLNGLKRYMQSINNQNPWKIT